MKYNETEKDTLCGGVTRKGKCFYSEKKPESYTLFPHLGFSSYLKLMNFAPRRKVGKRIVLALGHIKGLLVMLVMTGPIRKEAWKR